MIDLTKKTYAAIRSEMLDQIPDTYDKRDTAPIPTALSPAAYALEGFYLTLNQVQQQAFIQLATGQSLDYLSVLGGISRYKASPAIRLGIFNVAVPVGARFSTINGAASINFVVTEPTTGSTDDFYYKLTAETSGVIGNEYTGPILPITTIVGLTSAQITDILVPGDDTESDEELRSRLISALTEKPFGGNIADYRRNIMAIDGVGGVQVYPVWQGGGTVSCSILGADYMPASTELVKNIQTAIDPPTSGQGLGLAPIGAKVTIMAPSKLVVNVTATVKLSAGYSVGKVQSGVETAISNYLLSVRQEWDKQLGVTTVEYQANVYLARMISAILTVTGIVNATNVQLNGGTTDLTLQQTGASQQVPVMGTVTLNESV